MSEAVSVPEQDQGKGKLFGSAPGCLKFHLRVRVFDGPDFVKVRQIVGAGVGDGLGFWLDVQKRKACCQEAVLCGLTLPFEEVLAMGASRVGVVPHFPFHF